MEGLSHKKRIRYDSSNLGFESPETKRIKEDLLETLNDDCEVYATSHELESFMKSFEEEIMSASTQTQKKIASLEASESRQELCYLMEASDDELGLPSSAKEGKKEIVELSGAKCDSLEFSGGLWGTNGVTTPICAADSRHGVCSGSALSLWTNTTETNGELSGFDSFDMGANAENYCNEYLTLDILFDYSDPNPGLWDVAWRPDTLLAK